VNKAPSILLLLVCSAAASAQTEAGSGVLEGTIRLKSNGEPVPKAHVTLHPSNDRILGEISRRPPDPMSRQVVSTITDSKGHFKFGGVQAGQYYIDAQKPGFLLESDAGTRRRRRMLDITDGTNPSLDMKMVAQAVVTGRILDEDGDPLQGVSVILLRRGTFLRQREFAGAGGNATDDRGIFRIANVTAGKYVLMASVQGRFDGGALILPGQTARTGMGYPIMFYPDTSNPGSAAPIPAKAGEEVSGIQMTMPRTKVFRISGRIVSSGGSPAQRTTVQVVRDGTEMFGFGSETMVPREDGTFNIDSVMPGNYRIVARQMEGPGETSSMAVDRISVSGSDVKGVELTMRRGLAINGTIHVAGVGSQPDLSKVEVTLVPTSPIFTAPRDKVEVQPDGKFHIANVMPGTFMLNVKPPGDLQNAYIASTTAGGRDALAKVLDLSTGVAGPLKIEIRTDGATIVGSVNSDELKDAKNPTALLLQVSKDGSGLAAVDLNGITPTAEIDDRSGQFRFTRLPPGEYQVLAIGNYEPDMANDPDLLQSLASSAVKIEAAAGQTSSAQPKLFNPPQS
jgi:protocatechuate 3,4-dioxygenase beta subunit